MKIEIKLFNDRACFAPAIRFGPARRPVRAADRERGLPDGSPRRKHLKPARIY